MLLSAPLDYGCLFFKIDLTLDCVDLPEDLLIFLEPKSGPLIRDKLLLCCDDLYFSKQVPGL